MLRYDHEYLASRLCWEFAAVLLRLDVELVQGFHVSAEVITRKS